MIDRVTKALLAAIALGLWVNAVNPWIRPLPAWGNSLGEIYTRLQSLDGDLNKIEKGSCRNKKIC